MKRLRLLLLMPWVATPTLGRILAIAVLAIQLLAAMAVAATALMHGNRHLSQTAVLLFGYAIWMWSALTCANLQLVRDARELCLPRIARNANPSLLLLWGIGVGLPTIACIALGAPWLATLVFFVFAAAVGLAYMLLPFYLCLPLTIVAFVMALLHGPTALAGTWTPGTWSLPAAAALLIAAWRWRQLQRPGARTTTGWNTAVLFYCYRRDVMLNGGWPNLEQAFLQQRLAAPGRVDFRSAGPGRPVTALRLALGGAGMPKPLPARLRDVFLMLAYTLLFSLVVLVPAAFDAHRHMQNAMAIRLHWLSPLLTFFAVLACMIGVSMFAARVRGLWRKQDAELPLLALLPGLGDAASAKRRTVIASLAPPAVFLACTCAVLCIATLALRATPWAYVSQMLCCAGALVLIAAITLTSLCGRPMHTVGYVLLYAAQFVLSILLLIKTIPTDQYHGPHPEQFGVVPAWMLVLWGVYLLMLIILTAHGARQLRKRPHAFLANAS